VPHHQGETAVGHHLTEIVGVTNETVHAVGNEPALDAQREVLLGVGGDHEHAAHNAQTDAKAEPNVIGQWVAKKIARSTPPHRIIRAVKVRLGISFEGVSDGSRGPAHASELNGGGDVKRHTYQQDDPAKPE